MNSSSANRRFVCRVLPREFAFTFFCLTAGASILSGALANAATLSVEEVEASPGDVNITVDVSLETKSSEQVSDMQFDLAFNDEHLEFVNAEIGPAASAANKTLQSNQLEPGVVRLVISGLNQNAIPDGVVAKTSFALSETAPNEKFVLDAENVILSDPTGLQVFATAVSGGIIAGYPFGDVNRDGRVDAIDIQLVINYVLGLPMPPGVNGDDVDVNDDGNVNAQDIQLVINAVLGISARYDVAM